MRIYKTNSLALASALSLFFPILNIEKDESSNNCVFCFEDNGEIRELISNFWDKKLWVDASEYFAQIKNLKARIYENL